MEESVAKKWGIRNDSLSKFSPHLNEWQKLTIGLWPLKESKNSESKVTKNVKHI